MASSYPPDKPPSMAVETPSTAYPDEDDGGTFNNLRRQLSDPVDTRLAGSYSLPVAAPDLVGDRPVVGSVEGADEAGRNCAPQLLARGGGAHPEVTTGMQLILVVAFLCVDSSRYIISTWGLHGIERPSLVAQSFVFMQSVTSFTSAAVISGCWLGLPGLKEAVSPCEALRWLPVSIGFSLAQAAIFHAFGQGLGAATAVAIGYLYMPLSAVISRWLFRRAYGWLELHALALLTLTALAFAELRSRVFSLSENASGSNFAFLSVAFACLSSLMSEWVLKPKYSSPGQRGAPHFCVQKVRLEFWGAITSGILLLIIRSNSDAHCHGLCLSWDARLMLALPVGVVQGWLAGLTAKYLSTVAKAVVQCVSSLIIFFSADQIISGKFVITLPIGLLGFVVALSALMYQMGRRRTVKRKRVGTRHARLLLDPEPALSQSVIEDDAVGTRPSGVSEPIFVSDAQALAPSEFGPHGSERQANCWPQCPRLDVVVDRTWLQQARTYNARLADWASSRSGIISQLACVVAFIAADVTRTLVYEWALAGTAIVQQSLVVAMSAASIAVGAVLAGVLEGRHGLMGALDMREAVRYFPVSFCFSLGTTCTIFAYGVGVSGVQVTVIGYAYIPLSAMLSRWIFKRAYGTLEWLALILMVLSVSAFVLLQNSGGESKLTLFGVSFVLVSVVLSCLGSMLAEKIMKAGHLPFYMQNTSLQIGSLVTAVIMLFVDGALSNRPNDAFWRPRDIGGGVMAQGIFVAWGPKIFAALAASTLQAWLAGLVAKRLSTVTRSVAQCLELVIIYFVGDLLMKGQKFDWPVGSLALAVALTVQVFAQAGRDPDAVPVETTPPACERDGAGQATLTCES